jgi:hypothetical protein
MSSCCNSVGTRRSIHIYLLQVGTYMKLMKHFGNHELEISEVMNQDASEGT